MGHGAQGRPRPGRGGQREPRGSGDGMLCRCVRHCRGSGSRKIPSCLLRALPGLWRHLPPCPVSAWFRRKAARAFRNSLPSAHAHTHTHRRPRVPRTRLVTARTRVSSRPSPRRWHRGPVPSVPDVSLVLEAGVSRHGSRFWARGKAAMPDGESRRRGKVTGNRHCLVPNSPAPLHPEPLPSETQAGGGRNSSFGVKPSRNGASGFPRHRVLPWRWRGGTALAGNAIGPPTWPCLEPHHGSGRRGRGFGVCLGGFGAETAQR